MARGDNGTVEVATSGTAVKITTSIAASSKVRASDVVLVVSITPRATNTGDAMYYGTSNVTTTYGSRIPKGTAKTFNYEPGGDKFNSFYVDSDSGGDLIDWTVVFV